jgi:gluconolactonase
MKKPVVNGSLAVAGCLLAGVLGLAQVAAERPFKIVTLDPALREIIAPDASLETLGDHFGLTEGPVWVQHGDDGYLLFSDNAGNEIYKWSPYAPLSVFLQKSGYTGNDRDHVGAQTVTGGGVAIILIGSNGLTLDSQGRLIITAMTDRTVVRLESDGTRTPLADRYDGKRFNGPNDIVAKSDGAIYFTDTIWGVRNTDKGDRGLPYSGFFLIKDGKVTLLGGDKDNPGNAPNGIALSPDEKHLYVTAGTSKTMRYDVLPDDTVANPVKFLDGGNDGIKVDLKGNVYSIVRNEVWITSPEGKRLGTLELPVVASEPRPRIVGTNLAFGDADSKTLYITACTHLYRVRLKVAGVRPGPQR